MVTQRRELVLKRKRCHSVRNEGSNKRVSHHYPQQVHLVTSRPAFGVYANAFNFINHALTTFTSDFANEYTLNLTNPSGTNFNQGQNNPSLGFGSAPYSTGRRVVELMAKYSF